MIRILFFGDVVGEIGLRALQKELPRLRKSLQADFVIVNGENVCKGRGLTYKEYRALVEAGSDCITLGNHYRGRDQIDDYIQEAGHLMRPLNLKTYYRGEGSATFEVEVVDVTVTNLLGTAFMKEEVDDPIASCREILGDSSIVHIVDYHAESTSEKAIFAEVYRGQVSAVIGTHTHVQTADEGIRGGTAFLSDVGYCGMRDGIIGYVPESVVGALVRKTGERFQIAEEGPTEIDFAILDIDPISGNCVNIEPVRLLDGKEFARVSHRL